ncbi:WXG100 family type VII secretion target [Paenibacillus faecalis]|uniref:WXG100 family type VII secretion target n=1 Tax=Paenibacillus faecalis TaxID=2079532 RepID=UPI000D114210|nr:WXG100 family type VII secretion target [Paenibacillus faecalis]
MSKILISPTQLLNVSEQFKNAANSLEQTKDTLNTQISMMMFVWDGVSKHRFFQDFQVARNEMKLTIECMQWISVELKEIAQKFIAADVESGKFDPRCVNPDLLPPGFSYEVPEEEGPKNLLDHAAEFAQGIASGAKILGDSLVDTGKALLEDPLGTAGQMAYDATVGTAEEVVITGVWGAKMLFDVDDTREKFEEKLNAEQEIMNQMGVSEYLGQKGAMIAGGIALSRAGIREMPNFKHDSGGDGGGSPEKDEGTPKASNFDSVVKDGIKTKYINSAGNELTWVDQHPNNINRDIDSFLKSTNVGKATEAKVADFARNETEVVGFGQKILKKDGQPAGDLDVVTKNAIIEVKASIKSVDAEQFLKMTNQNHPDFFNSENKKIILYIDKLLVNLRSEHEKMLEDIKSQGVTIVNSLDDLKGELE